MSLINNAIKIITIGSLLLPFSSIFASEGEEILKLVEASISKDQSSTVKMILKNSSGGIKERVLSMKQKGSDLRLIKFKNPADVKGVGFLVLSESEMYLYMPEFGKVRRIASHIKNESFMGTDFSYNDIGETKYSDDYTSELKSKNEKEIVLSLTPRDLSESDYSNLTMTISIENNYPVKLEYFDKKGEPWKVMTQKDIEKVSGYWIAKSVTMSDLKKKHSTTMEISDLQLDTGLVDTDFTRRKLKRSR